VIELQLEGFLRMLHKRLSRFDPGSELARLNAADQELVEVSSVLSAALDAGIWAARRSGGLVDPTLVGEIEQAGYRRSLRGATPAPLADAIAAAPRRRPAAPNPRSRWAEIDVDAVEGVVRRPPGVRFDTGGCGKGLAADLVAERLGGYSIFAVDAGGDLRIGGDSPPPRQVRIQDPLNGGTAHVFELSTGAVGTSGISTRVWRTEDGFNHHLLDPSTGRPAWTGVIQASAIAPTALEAETLAKMAVLLGPVAGAELLAEQGGLLIEDSGRIRAFEADGAPERSPAGVR
jgi:thiamine biosynthesis lipoprotein